MDSSFRRSQMSPATPRFSSPSGAEDRVVERLLRLEGVVLDLQRADLTPVLESVRRSFSADLEAVRSYRLNVVEECLRELEASQRRHEALRDSVDKVEKDEQLLVRVAEELRERTNAVEEKLSTAFVDMKDQVISDMGNMKELSDGMRKAADEAIALEAKQRIALEETLVKSIRSVDAHLDNLTKDNSVFKNEIRQVVLNERDERSRMEEKFVGGVEGTREHVNRTVRESVAGLEMRMDNENKKVYDTLSSTMSRLQLPLKEVRAEIGNELTSLSTALDANSQALATFRVDVQGNIENVEAIVTTNDQLLRGLHAQLEDNVNTVAQRQDEIAAAVATLHGSLRADIMRDMKEYVDSIVAAERSSIIDVKESLAAEVAARASVKEHADRLIAEERSRRDDAVASLHKNLDKNTSALQAEIRNLRGATETALREEANKRSTTDSETVGVVRKLESIVKDQESTMARWAETVDQREKTTQEKFMEAENSRLALKQDLSSLFSTLQDLTSSHADKLASEMSRQSLLLNQARDKLEGDIESVRHQVAKVDSDSLNRSERESRERSTLAEQFARNMATLTGETANQMKNLTARVQSFESKTEQGITQLATQANHASNEFKGRIEECRNEARDAASALQHKITVDLDHLSKRLSAEIKQEEVSRASLAETVQEAVARERQTVEAVVKDLGELTSDLEGVSTRLETAENSIDGVKDSASLESGRRLELEINIQEKLDDIDARLVMEASSREGVQRATDEALSKQEKGIDAFKSDMMGAAEKDKNQLLKRVEHNHAVVLETLAAETHTRSEMVTMLESRMKETKSAIEMNTSARVEALSGTIDREVSKLRSELSQSVDKLSQGLEKNSKNTSRLDEKITRECASLKDWATKKMVSDEAKASGALNLQTNEIRQRIDSAERTLGEAIKSGDEKLKESLDKASLSLSERCGRTEEKLSQLVSTVASNYDTNEKQAKDIQADLERHVATLSADDKAQAERLEEMNEALSESIARGDTEITERLESNVSRLLEGIESVQNAVDAEMAARMRDKDSIVSDAASNTDRILSEQRQVLDTVMAQNSEYSRSLVTLETSVHEKIVNLRERIDGLSADTSHSLEKLRAVQAESEKRYTVREKTNLEDAKKNLETTRSECMREVSLVKKDIVQERAERIEGVKGALNKTEKAATSLLQGLDEVRAGIKQVATDSYAARAQNQQEVQGWIEKLSTAMKDDFANVRTDLEAQSRQNSSRHQAATESLQEVANTLRRDMDGAVMTASRSSESAAETMRKELKHTADDFSRQIKDEAHARLMETDDLRQQQQREWNDYKAAQESAHLQVERSVNSLRDEVGRTHKAIQETVRAETQKREEMETSLTGLVHDAGLKARSAEATASQAVAEMTQRAAAQEEKNTKFHHDVTVTVQKHAERMSTELTTTLHKVSKMTDTANAAERSATEAKERSDVTLNKVEQTIIQYEKENHAFNVAVETKLDNHKKEMTDRVTAAQDTQRKIHQETKQELTSMVHDTRSGFDSLRNTVTDRLRQEEERRRSAEATVLKTVKDTMDALTNDKKESNERMTAQLAQEAKVRAAALAEERQRSDKAGTEIRERVGKLEHYVEDALSRTHDALVTRLDSEHSALQEEVTSRMQMADNIADLIKSTGSRVNEMERAHLDFAATMRDALAMKDTAIADREKYLLETIQEQVAHVKDHADAVKGAVEAKLHEIQEEVVRVVPGLEGGERVLQLINRETDDRIASQENTVELVNKLFTDVADLKMQNKILAAATRDSEEGLSAQKSRISEQVDDVLGVISKSMERQEQHGAVTDANILDLRFALKSLSAHMDSLINGVPSSGPDVPAQTTLNSWYTPESASDPIDVAVHQCLRSLRLPHRVKVQRLGVGSYIIDKHITIIAPQGQPLVKSTEGHYVSLAAYVTRIQMPEMVRNLELP